MSLIKIILADPFILLETVTLVVALGSLIKLTLEGWPLDSQLNPAVKLPGRSSVGGSLNFALLPAVTRKVFTNPLLSLFEVGTLISTPKQSLRQQRTFLR